MVGLNVCKEFRFTPLYHEATTYNTDDDDKTLKNNKNYDLYIHTKRHSNDLKN